MGTTFLERLGSLLYIVNPKTTMFEHPSEIPDYVNDAVPFFIVMIHAELFIRFLQGKKFRPSESVSTAYIGILHESTVFITRVIMLLGYEWLFQYRIVTLPWNSLSTWFAGLVFIDFCYYWIHRMNHEINLLWAAHQVHHSGEDYNLGLSLRLSIFQRVAHFGFYQPLALIGFPLSVVMVHAAFNYIFQFWVHTSMFRSIGPLEYVIMSPSHHRVHHGSNKWCLDKNYASVFVLWDRIFGTFEPERKDEEIVYGLTSQPQTHNPIYHELFYFKELYDKVRSMDSWTDKMKALFYGPGWVPGSPRLGDPATFPEITAGSREKYDPHFPLWLIAYTLLHLYCVVFVQRWMFVRIHTASLGAIFLYLSGIFTTAGIIGGIIDNRWWAPSLEIVRCGIVIVYTLHNNISFTGIMDLDRLILSWFFISIIIWTALTVNSFSSQIYLKYKSYKIK